MQQHEFPKVHCPRCRLGAYWKGKLRSLAGPGSGIGKPAAAALGATGANVCVNYVTGPDKAVAVGDQIKVNDSDAFAYQADVSKQNEHNRNVFDRPGTIWRAGYSFKQCTPIYR